MIGPVPPATPETQDRQPRQGKPQAKPGTLSSRHYQESDEFQDTIQLSPEALAAAHDDDVDYDA